MQKIALLVFVSLSCMALQGADFCSTIPKNCEFKRKDYSGIQGSFCNWKFTGVVDYYYYFFSSDGYITFFSERGKREFTLTSRIVCSTTEQYCLWFSYRIVPNNSTDLIVSIRYEDGYRTELPVWIMSRSNGWDYGGVQIQSHQNFRIVIKTKSFSDVTARVSLDDIVYTRSNHCVPFVAPARGTSSSTREPMNNSSASTGQTGMSTNLTMAAHSNTSSEGILEEFVLLETSTTSSRPENDAEMCNESSNKVVIALGVILAILLAINIVVVTFLVLRRKQLGLEKLCCVSKERKEEFRMNASHNAAYTLGPDIPNHPTGASQQNYEESTYAQSSANCNSANASASPKGPDGEYNSFDFDKKSFGNRGKTEGASMAAYSHLNAGSEGAYNELHRDKKERVIDGEYSHIKKPE